ncbi:MAG: cysteine desulfurase-like protein [Fimbriimonas sp.]|nr:cysteine desulfurase-like protein [Fimbriimonas sp.]
MSSVSRSAPIAPSRSDIRAWFPTLATDFAFLENAGGSQVPGVVADAIRDYMLSRYVQLGAGYRQSIEASGVVADAHAYVETLVNATGIGKVVLGQSTTSLLHVLADAYMDTWQAGDEVIIAETNHEANAGPWVKLAKRGIVLRTWKVNPETFGCPLEALAELLNDRTKIVAFPHVSNLLGEVVDVKAITELVHRAGARVVADGVAYAPHRAIDVADWGVDWYVYSTYKVYGPHMAALYGRHDAFAGLTGPNHFFIPKESIPYKFELGSISHEGCAGILALRSYLRFLAGWEVDDRQTVVDAFAIMEELEAPMRTRLIQYLRSKPKVRLIGLADEGTKSVGTISFLHNDLPSTQIVASVDRHNIGIRYGHMYAVRLCEALGIDLAEGVVRVSMVHYNTPDEIDRLIGVLDTFL